MRKVIASELESLDGTMESPEEWASPYSNDEMEEANASGMAASDTVLLGRVTYEAFAAYWPHQPGGVPMVDYINSVPKFDLFEDGGDHKPLKLVDSKAFSTGVLYLTYRPADEQGA